MNNIMLAEFDRELLRFDMFNKGPPASFELHQLCEVTLEFLKNSLNSIWKLLKHFRIIAIKVVDFLGKLHFPVFLCLVLLFLRQCLLAKSLLVSHALFNSVSVHTLMHRFIFQLVVDLCKAIFATSLSSFLDSLRLLLTKESFRVITVIC